MPDLRPGNRGIGVSVAVGHHRATGIGTVARTVIRTLEAWDQATHNQVKIQPGTLLDSCRILRNRDDDAAMPEVYLMEFESAGKRYCCPLAHFQPRTLAAEPLALGLPGEPFRVEKTQPARDSLAV
jgi:hypothetical protein